MADGRLPGRNLKSVIASNLIYLMRIYGKSRKDVCADLDISYTTFCDWINARTYPRLDALENLGYYFRIGTRDFFVEIEKNHAMTERLTSYASLLGVCKDSRSGKRGGGEKDGFTVEDYYETPEGYPVELIRGQFYICESPSTRHQAIVVEMCSEIRNYIRRKGGSCRVFAGPFDVELPVAKATVVVPDITVVCDRTLLTPKGCKGTPDWIIEIWSPATRGKDKKEKLAVYDEAGVREYWMVDPECNKVYVYRRAEQKDQTHFAEPEIYDFDADIRAGIYEDFSINMSALDLLFSQ
jgi:Uma2 family endonuclease